MNTQNNIFPLGHNRKYCSLFVPKAFIKACIYIQGGFALWCGSSGEERGGVGKESNYYWKEFSVTKLVGQHNSVKQVNTGISEIRQLLPGCLVKCSLVFLPNFKHGNFEILQCGVISCT